MVGGPQCPHRLSLCGPAGADQVQALAKELVALQPDVILAHSTQVAAALQRESRAIPIVFVNVSDPIGAGFIASLARPGGNLTGVLHYEAGIAGKWLAMLKEIAPRLARAALVMNPKTAPMTTSCGRPRPWRRRSRSSLCPARSRTAADIERAIESFARVPNGGLVLPPDATTVVHRDLIIALAARHRLPAVYSARFFGRGRRSHVLRDRPGRHVSAGGVLCRPHPARRQARRPSGAGADQVRNDDQSQNRESARPDRAADAAGAPPTR